MSEQVEPIGVRMEEETNQVVVMSEPYRKDVMFE